MSGRPHSAGCRLRVRQIPFRGTRPARSRFSRTRPARDVHGATFLALILALTTGGELPGRAWTYHVFRQRLSPADSSRPALTRQANGRADASHEGGAPTD